MFTKTSRLTSWFVIFLVMTFSAVLMAQTSDTSSTEMPSTSEKKSHDILENIKFRNLGPAVGGGRVTSVVGVPGQPNIYYAGAAAGGVFKTVDGGLSWKPIFEKQPVASIGAIALAPTLCSPEKRSSSKAEQPTRQQAPREAA